MQKLTLTLVSLSLVGTYAQAQLRNSQQSTLDSLKDTRKHMENMTELTVLEQLEEARLRDEEKRRQQYEALNFSVIEEPKQ